MGRAILANDMATVVFCNDYLAPRTVDPDFITEYEAARDAGFDTVLVPYEDLSKGLGPSLRIEQAIIPGTAIYRGWMLTLRHYEQLYAALAEQDLRLVNSPTEYAHTHHFPHCYPFIAENTPFSISTRIDDPPDFDVIHALLVPFGPKPIMVKDFVKSEKHHWKEACFIPNAADRAQVEQVTRRFLELRGEHLNEGLVYREFIPLAHLSDHPKSGMPTAVEFRLFFVNGALMSASPYWEDGEYTDALPPTVDFERIARKVQSRFFSMDIAKREDGRWTIMELGDGQVSGLPLALDPKVFYERLFAAVNAAA